MEEKKEMNTHKESIIFVFDLHNVVFKLHYRGIIHQLCAMEHKMRLLLRLLQPAVLLDIIKLLYSSKVSEEYIVELARRHPELEPYIEHGIDICNEQLPMTGTVELINELYEQGYKLYILSNIGERTYAKLKKHYPEIFDRFSAAQVATVHDNWVQKPQPQAFTKFLKSINAAPENIVFIDDHAQNIATAQKLGIGTIHFSNADQLRTALQCINALPDKTTSDSLAVKLKKSF